MFERKKKETKIIGAREKIELAKRIKKASKANVYFDNNEVKIVSQTVPVAVIFMVSVVLALFLTDKGGSAFFGGFSTGFYELDLLLVGPGIPSLIGDADINRVLVIFIRGFAYFLLTGLAPLIAFLFIKIIGKNRMNPIVACWLFISILSFLYTSRDSFLSVINEFIKGI